MRLVSEPAVTCRNCGQPTGPQFCGFCGQRVDDRRAPILSLLRDWVEEWLSIEGRTIRTLRRLIHPGELTRLYLDGKRVAFLAPFRLYLLASLVLFSSVLTLQPLDARTINLYVAGQLLTESPAVRGRPSITILENDNMARWIMATHYADNFARLRARPPQEVVNALFNGLRSVLPLALIAFVPLVALALKVLYVRRGLLYVDHLIFAVHFQSALFFALATTWIVLRLAQASAVVSLVGYLVVFLLMVTVYLSRALRRVYGEARLTRWAKAAALVVAYIYALAWVWGPAVMLVVSWI
jgi:hypothetical protein